MKTAMQEAIETLSKELRQLIESQSTATNISELRQIKGKIDAMQFAIGLCLHQIKKERQQIEDAFTVGDANQIHPTIFYADSETYYNQTYNNESK